MTTDDIEFFKREKLKFHELLTTIDWTEDRLLQEQETMFKCPIDRGHRFPERSKHLERCQLIKEGFSKEYLKELAQCEQEKKLLNQSNISFTAARLSDIVNRPITITQNLQLNIEQTTILFSPSERSLIAQAVHNEAVNLGIVPLAPHYFVDDQTSQSINSITSQRLNKLDALRDQNWHRPKYVTRTIRKNFYDTAREMIHTGMKLLEQLNQQSKLNQHEQDKRRIKQIKHKHRSSSRKKRRSTRSNSRKPHRHSKKRRKS